MLSKYLVYLYFKMLKLTFCGGTNVTCIVTFPRIATEVSRSLFWSKMLGCCIPVLLCITTPLVYFGSGDIITMSRTTGEPVSHTCMSNFGTLIFVLFIRKRHIFINTVYLQLNNTKVMLLQTCFTYAYQ